MILKTLLSCFLVHFVLTSPFYIPVKTNDRKDISKIQLTEIGKFGLIRKARKTVPSHLHTGIDIKRPSSNYINEPIFTIATGKVISKRVDGPYAQLIIEHQVSNNTFWTVYEHIAGITANLNETVTPNKPIARFMNKAELNKHGWQFDHFHLEILKIKPTSIKPSKLHPERFFNAYSLICYTSAALENHYYNPISFLKENLY